MYSTLLLSKTGLGPQGGSGEGKDGSVDQPRGDIVDWYSKVSELA